MPSCRRSATHVRARSAVTALALVSALALNGCSVTNVPADTGSVHVVATTTQLADFCVQIVGATGDVTSLIRPNQTAHNFDPTARDLVDVGEANALVINGLGLEPWLEGVEEASGFGGRLITASEDVPLLADDPHVWTSPANARVMVTTIAEGLAQARPDLANVFEVNAAAYEAQLALLDEWAREAMTTVPEDRRILVTNHDALAYFVDEFGITFLGSILPSLDDNAEPSAADVDALVVAIRQSGATAIFSENTVSPKLATTIAQEAGVRVYSGAEALYADSLGSAGTAGASYIAATIHNVTVLVTAWGGHVPSLPEGLSA